MSAAPAMTTLPYDPARDFAAIANVVKFPLVIVAHPGLPATTIQEFAALARDRPADCASGGPGSTQHLAGELFRRRLGLRLNHVAYRGSPPALTDLLAGVVPAMVDSVASSLPHIRAGRVRALAVSTPERLAWLPAVPTIAETLIPGFEVQGWAGLVAPAGTPETVLRRVNADAVAALREPAMLARFEELGAVPAAGPAEEFAALIRDEAARWRAAVREAGIRIDGGG